MSTEHTVIHLLAGGAGGTAGAVVTCPLEVVKTRLQSSVATFGNGSSMLPKVNVYPSVPKVSFSTAASIQSSTVLTQTAGQFSTRNIPVPSLTKCLRHILKTEGAKGLFKGLGPNLVGVAPSRAIYFYAYAQAKVFFNSFLKPDTPFVHILSASCAGFTASTSTNPLWYIKTRLQLDQKRDGSLTVKQCVRQTYRTHGIVGFYKGITASYYGVCETVIHFVIYEAIKARLRAAKAEACSRNGADQTMCTMDFVELMAAGALSKTIATCFAYPHEVARTRLRQEGDRYRGFWQTLHLVFKEEGSRGLYRGLTTQLVRQIPNTAIMMSTYELVVYMFETMENGK